MKHDTRVSEFYSFFLKKEALNRKRMRVRLDLVFHVSHIG